MNAIPQNLIPWAIGSLIFFLFAIRAFITYRNLNSPLSRYFGITGLLVSLGWALWILPFVIIDVNSYRLLSHFVISVGDIAMYSALVLQTRVLWYLALKDSLPYIYLGLPAFMVAVVGLIAGFYSGIASDSLPALINGDAFYPKSDVANATWIVLLVFALLVAAVLFRQVGRQTTNRSKFGLLAVCVLYTGAPIAAGINAVSGAATNSSPIILITYFVTFSLFAVSFLVFRLIDRHNKSKSKQN